MNSFVLVQTKRNALNSVYKKYVVSDTYEKIINYIYSHFHHVKKYNDYLFFNRDGIEFKIMIGERV